MNTYTVKTIMPCHVTFVYRVEAEDEDEAVDQFLGSGAEFVREEVGETISYLDHSGFEIEEGDPKTGKVSFAGEKAARPEDPYSVLLLYPDYANDSGTETYYAFVAASDPLEAVALAKRQAFAAQEGVIFPPDDFAPLLVTQGHHASEPLFNK